MMDGLRQQWPRLVTVLGVDGFGILLLWLAEAKQLGALVRLILLAGLLWFFGGWLWDWTHKHRREQRFRQFLTNPDRCNEERLCEAVMRQEREAVALLGSVLREQQRVQKELRSDLRDYEEYVEGWAHEAKTPLSLLTMLLDNHGKELPPDLQVKLDYVRSQLQEDVTQMLYYARLKSSTKDYFFERVDLGECIAEVLEDYGPLLEEKQFTIAGDLYGNTVYTDRRGLTFMLGQIVSNAIKYSQEDPKITFTLHTTSSGQVLTVTDCGMGVSPYDLPYLFQKGFTGDSTDSRKKATGMGLYLTKRMAEDLHLGLEAVSEWHKSFSIRITFPVPEPPLGVE